MREPVSGNSYSLLRFTTRSGVIELSEGSLAKFPFGGTRPMARVFNQDGSVAEW